MGGYLGIRNNTKLMKQLEKPAVTCGDCHDVLPRLHSAWADPDRLAQAELRDLLSKAITEIEALRLLVDKGKLTALEDAVRENAPR